MSKENAHIINSSDFYSYFHKKYNIPKRTLQYWSFKGWTPKGKKVGRNIYYSTCDVEDISDKLVQKWTLR